MSTLFKDGTPILALDELTRLVLVLYFAKDTVVCRLSYEMKRVSWRYFVRWLPVAR